MRTTEITVKSNNAAYLLVDNNTNGSLCHIPHFACATVVHLVWHTLHSTVHPTLQGGYCYTVQWHIAEGKVFHNIWLTCEM